MHRKPFYSEAKLRYLRAGFWKYHQPQAGSYLVAARRDGTPTGSCYLVTHVKVSRDGNWSNLRALRVPLEESRRIGAHVLTLRWLPRRRLRNAPRLEPSSRSSG